MPLHLSSWSLDAWGTWANRLTMSPTPGENDDPENVDALTLAHTPDPRAAIGLIDRTLTPHGGTPQVLPTVVPDHDAAGNIVYDGTYIYQYDAWSRLVQVNLAAQPPPGGGPAIGDAVPGTQQLAGPLVKHFTYDGLGRLVRVLSPYPEPGSTPPEGWTTAPVRSERLYYDGVRRIQEVYTDPLLALGESAAQGSGSAQSAINEGGEEEGQTLEGEEGQIGEGEGEPGGEDPPGGSPNTFITYLEREYLWGPGDGITGGAGAGLDELIGIFDIDRRAWWTLLDASGDVVAIVDDGEATAHGFGPGTSTSPARLCAQFAYDPYGALLAVQDLHPFPDPRTGHKGLHLDRLDAGVADPLPGAPIARHAVGATHAYFVRNRHYSPDLGRFMQRDPNGTLLPLVEDFGHPTDASGVGFAQLALAAHVADGVGAQVYLRGSPLTGHDTFGRFMVLAQLVEMSIQVGVSAEATLEEAHDGVVQVLTFSEMLFDYAFTQIVDSDWAADWSLPDSDYSSAGQQAKEIDERIFARGVSAAAEELQGIEMAGRGPKDHKGVRSHLHDVSRRVYNARRAAFGRLRAEYWRTVASSSDAKKYDYDLRNKGLMGQGLAPYGTDGEKMVLHHKTPLMHGGTNEQDNLQPKNGSEHRRDYKELHKYVPKKRKTQPPPARVPRPPRSPRR